MNDKVILQLPILDAASLVQLQCSHKSKDSLRFDIDKGEREQFGVAECQQLMKICSQTPPGQDSGMNFDPRMSHKYMSRMKKVVIEAVWKGPCPD